MKACLSDHQEGKYLTLWRHVSQIIRKENSWLYGSKSLRSSGKKIFYSMEASLNHIPGSLLGDQSEAMSWEQYWYWCNRKTIPDEATWSEPTQWRWPLSTLYHWGPGPCLNIKTGFPGMGIPMLKIRWSLDRLIFNMGIPILVRQHLYFEMAPWFNLSIRGFFPYIGIPKIKIRWSKHYPIFIMGTISLQYSTVLPMRSEDLVKLVNVSWVHTLIWNPTNFKPSFWWVRARKTYSSALAMELHLSCTNLMIYPFREISLTLEKRNKWQLPWHNPPLVHQQMCSHDEPHLSDQLANWMLMWLW